MRDLLWLGSVCRNVSTNTKMSSTPIPRQTSSVTGVRIESSVYLNPDAGGRSGGSVFELAY